MKNRIHFILLFLFLSAFSAFAQEPGPLSNELKVYLKHRKIERKERMPRSDFSVSLKFVSLKSMLLFREKKRSTSKFKKIHNALIILQNALLIYASGNDGDFPGNLDILVQEGMVQGLPTALYGAQYTASGDHYQMRIRGLDRKIEGDTFVIEPF